MRNEIESSILSKATIQYGTHYYQYEEAFQLIDLCQKAAIPILGIDSFIVTDAKTQPFLEHSIDLSFSKSSYEDARNFLNSKRMYNFVFEIVYENRM